MDRNCYNNNVATTLTPHGYLQRVVDREVAEALDSAPIVVIEGPKACGKTWTGRHHAQSEASFEQDEQARAQARLLPHLLLDGTEPRLIDEWQIVPEIWNTIRHLADEERRNGRFVLTGTARPGADGIRHSGAGRIMRIRLRPMSLSEAGVSTEQVSLGALVSGEPCAADRPAITVPDLTDELCRGGWPEHLGLSTGPAQRRLRAYLDEMARADIIRAPRAWRPRQGPRQDRPPARLCRSEHSDDGFCRPNRSGHCGLGARRRCARSADCGELPRDPCFNVRRRGCTSVVGWPPLASPAARNAKAAFCGSVTGRRCAPCRA